MFQQLLHSPRRQFPGSLDSPFHSAFSPPSSHLPSPVESTPRSSVSFGAPFWPTQLQQPQTQLWEQQQYQTYPGAGFDDGWYTHDMPGWEAQYQYQQHHHHHQDLSSANNINNHNTNSNYTPSTRPRSNSAMYIPNTEGLPINLSLGAVITEHRGIFVGNLSYTTQWKDLKDYLSSVGRVLRCEVPQGTNGKGKGYATVLFETAEEAGRAVGVFNGREYMGRCLRVRHDKFAPTTGAGEGGRLRPTKMVGRGF